MSATALRAKHDVANIFNNLRLKKRGGADCIRLKKNKIKK
jgi:hypothetical protein